MIGYRIRLRVRLGKALSSDATLIVLNCDGRAIELKSQNPGEQLKHAKWIVVIAKDFETEERARFFGERLRALVEIAALTARVGADTGQDQPSSWMNEDWAKGKGLISKNQRILPDVHGLLVAPDDENSKIFRFEGTGTVTADPERFTGAITELSDAGRADLGDCAARVRLLNFALMSSEPLARAVLAFAAVEALGQDEEWSERQKERLRELALEVEGQTAREDDELCEIADALRRSLHRIGLRQGVMRVLDRLGLGDLKNGWDRLYGVRSGIFHGTEALSSDEANQFANEALELCAKIVIADVRRRGHHIPAVFEKQFGTALLSCHQQTTQATD